MKLFSFFIASLFLSSNMNAQAYKLEANSNWHKYNKVELKKYSNERNDWTYVYDLNEGKPISMTSFYQNQIRGLFYLEFDKNANLKAITITNSDRNYESSVFELNSKYNDLGLKIEDSSAKFVYDTNNRLILSYSISYEESNGKEGWSEKYFYDDFGNLIKQEKTTFRREEKQIDFESYIYDACKNIIQINRISSPEKKYPIVILGGEFKSEIDFYEYENNSDCIWIKKYKKVDGKMKLVSERVLTEI